MTADELLALADPTDADPWELTRRYRDVLAIIEQAKEIQAQLEEALVARMEEDVQMVPHVGVLRRSPVKTTSWKDSDASADFRKDVFGAVIDEVALDRITGERDQMRANIARQVTRALDAALPAFSSLKAAGAKQLGIRVDEYRTTRETYKVTLEVIE